jgi:hypothetical protein
MTMEYKAIPGAVKQIEGRTVTGIFAVHGNIDSYGDVSHPGSFAKTIAERLGRVKFLWNHDFYGGPPVAVVTALREVGRDELPDKVLELAPTATGGVEVTREYLKNDRAEQVFEAVATGAADEMSYGYDPVKMDFGEVDGQKVRHLREIRLWEVSDVIFGANPATAASKLHLPLDVLIKQLDAALTELKAGARHSAADIKALNSIHRAAVELGCSECAGFLEADEGKSRAEPVSLTLLSERLRLLQLSM